jgi:hypothetical protein
VYTQVSVNLLGGVKIWGSESKTQTYRRGGWEWINVCNTPPTKAGGSG